MLCMKKIPDSVSRESREIFQSEFLVVFIILIHMYQLSDSIQQVPKILSKSSISQKSLGVEEEMDI